MEQNKQELYKLLSTKECYIFIAGNAKDMPTSVKNVFISIFEEFEHLDHTKSRNIIDTLEIRGFYQTETWS